MSFIFHDKRAERVEVPAVFVWLLLGASVMAANVIAQIAKGGGW